MRTQRATTTITTGVAGSGKSYARCARFLADEFLPDETGVHCSNFPVNMEAVAAFVAKRTKRPVEEFAARMELIPRAVERTWMDETSGPWEFFAGRDIAGWHLAIDEAHNVCGVHHSPSHRKAWAQFCGELRHRGATVEFLSQNPEKLAKEVDREAGLRYSIVNSETRRDPFFKVPLGDWYELRAAFTGRYTPRVWQVEKRSVDGRWSEELAKSWPLTPEYFGLYNSYDAPKSGEAAGAAGKQYEFQKRSTLGVVLWFLRRNLFGMLPKLAVIGFLVFLLGGGGGTVAQAWTGFMSGVVSRNLANGPAAEQGKAEKGKAELSADALEEPLIEDPVVLRGHVATWKSEVERLRVEVGNLAGAREGLIRQLEEVRREVLRGSSLVMLADGVAVFDDGGRYAVGETVLTGEWRGMRIVEVDQADRAVVLSSGDRLRLGRFGADARERVQRAGAGGGGPGSAGVSDVVRRNAAEGRAAGDGRGPRAAGQR